MGAFFLKTEPASVMTVMRINKYPVNDPLRAQRTRTPRGYNTDNVVNKSISEGVFIMGLGLEALCGRAVDLHALEFATIFHVFHS